MYITYQTKWKIMPWYVLNADYEATQFNFSQLIFLTVSLPGLLDETSLENIILCKSFLWSQRCSCFESSFSLDKKGPQIGWHSESSSFYSHKITFGCLNLLNTIIKLIYVSCRESKLKRKKVQFKANSDASWMKVPAFAVDRIKEQS